MPIDKETFNIARNPSDLLIEFLGENQEYAYTVDEILESIPKLEEIGVSRSKIEDTLIGHWKITSSIVKGVVYYSSAIGEVWNTLI